MELILLRDVESVGRKGDVVKVRDGYARNFLLPRGMALRSTPSNQIFVEDQKARAAKRREKEKNQAQSQAESMKKLKLTFTAKAGENNKLFGSVTHEDIREELLKQGFDIDKKHIHLAEPIRALGAYQVSIDLYPQVKTTVTVEVVQES